ncbi:MAG: ferritin [Bacteroidetes bacterium]|nr:MAG: ferritin [Bacteroidota bacterium]
MISKRLEEELNKQINAEMYSAYLYLSMSAYLAKENLNGFSHWMKLQFEEEQGHAMKFFQYILDRGGNVELEEINRPQVSWNGIIDVFEEIYKHEQYITNLINNLVDVAIQERDHATVAMLQWYVSEQVEEESTVSELLDQLRIIDGKGSGLFMLDREAKSRSLTSN